MTKAKSLRVHIEVKPVTVPSMAMFKGLEGSLYYRDAEGRRVVLARFFNFPELFSLKRKVGLSAVGGLKKLLNTALGRNDFLLTIQPGVDRAFVSTVMQAFDGLLYNAARAVALQPAPSQTIFFSLCFLLAFLFHQRAVVTVLKRLDGF